jgi:outer membrane scaffolding protein for murein synthesis (MipA/OmpV family)
MDVVGTNTVKFSAKKTEGDVAIVCSASESMKSKSERTKKIQLYAFIILIPKLYVVI